jgi:hypothetical protein
MSDLPATHDDSFAAAANENFTPSQDSGGFLIFTKAGEWLFGQDEEPVDGLNVVIMSKMIEQGWIRWGTKPPAKVFARITQPYPDAPSSVEGLDNDGRNTTFNAAQARQFTGVFRGEDLGNFIFNTNSKGGVKAADKLYQAIIAQANKSVYFFPVVTLTSDSYKHSSYGKIYTPSFVIEKWVDVDGNEEGEAPKKLAEAKAEPKAKAKVEEPKQDAEAAPKRRRRTR